MDKLCYLLVFVAGLQISAVRAEDPSVRHSTWNGFKRLDFEVAGRAALLIVPKESAPGRPWIWRTEFFGHEPQADVTLVNKGFHAAYINVQNMYGGPEAMRLMDAFYADLRAASSIGGEGRAGRLQPRRAVRL